MRTLFLRKGPWGAVTAFVDPHSWMIGVAVERSPGPSDPLGQRRSISASFLCLHACVMFRRGYRKQAAAGSNG